MKSPRTEQVWGCGHQVMESWGSGVRKPGSATILCPSFGFAFSLVILMRSHLAVDVEIRCVEHLVGAWQAAGLKLIKVDKVVTRFSKPEMDALNSIFVGSERPLVGTWKHSGKDYGTKV